MSQNSPKKPRRAAQEKQHEAAETKARLKKWGRATLIGVGLSFMIYLIVGYNSVDAAEAPEGDIPDATLIQGPPTPLTELGFLDRVKLGAIFAYNGNTSPLVTIVGDDFDSRVAQLSILEMLTMEEHQSLLESKEEAVNARDVALIAKERWLNYLESAKGCLALTDGGET